MYVEVIARQGSGILEVTQCRPMSYWTLTYNLVTRLYIQPPHFVMLGPSGAKFCTVFQGRPGQGISHLGELCFPRSQKSDEATRT